MPKPNLKNSMQSITEPLEQRCHPNPKLFRGKGIINKAASQGLPLILFSLDQGLCVLNNLYCLLPT